MNQIRRRFGQNPKTRPALAVLLAGDNRLDFTKLRILPQFTSVLQGICRNLRDILPVIPSHNVQGEIDARGQASGSGNLSVIDESGSAHEVYCWVLLLHVRREQVVCGGGQPVEQAIMCEHLGTCTN